MSHGGGLCLLYDPWRGGLRISLLVRGNLYHESDVKWIDDDNDVVY